jgi:alpha-D-xyloside xylohydrolase
MEFITNLKRSTILILSLVAGLTCSAKDKQRTISVETADMKVKVEFYSPEIVRVVKQPKGAAPMEKKSFSVILHPGEKFGVDVDESKDGKYAMLSSSRMSVRLDKKTGQLLILGVEGTPIIKEKATKMEVRKGDADEGKLKVRQTWTLEDNEAIFGLGQLRDETMCWRGQKKILWNDNTYIAIPYITSEKGYGIYWDNAGKSLFEDSAEGMTFESEVAEGVDYYVMYRDGKQDGVIAAIRQLTGQATMFPLWTMGHWQCRERYKTSDELCDVLDKYRKLRIPLDGIVQDWQYWGCDSNWNAMRFENPYYINKVGDEQWAKYLPNDLKKLAEEYKKAGKQPRIKSPEEMAKYVHDNHAHLMISIWANFGPWTKAYQRLNEIGALLPFETWPKNNGVKPYDPFNAQARDIYWDELTNLYNIGFDAWWTDSTEPDHFAKEGDDDYKTSAGTWRSVKNAFPLMTNKGIYEHQRAMKGDHKRSVQMTRSGAMGIQHYGTFSWSGDIQATWAEMKKQVPSGLNYTLCGIPFWNTDLGGFFYWDMDNNPKSPAVQELQVRWMQWGTFMPLMRNHCSSPMVSELYEFGKEGDWAYDVMKQYIELRYRLLPYIYSMAGEVVQHSGLMMRPLLMDYTDDRKAILLNDEYMFGRELLVKPVTDPLYTWLGTDKKGHLIYPDVKKAAAPVEVYLPKGNDWYDFWTGEKVRGGRTVKRPCPINEMPVYVKAGSILPMGPQVQYSDEKPWDNLELRIYPGQDGKFTLYEDEGDNYNYEKGDFSEIQFSWNDKEKTLTIHQRKGEYKGMLKKRNFRIVIGAKGDKEPKKFDKTVSYEGKKVTVKL